MEQVVSFFRELVWLTTASIIGASVLFGCLYMVMSIHLIMWRKAAVHYGTGFRAQNNPSKLFGAAAIAERGIRWGMHSNRRQNVYPPIRVSVLPSGIGLAIMKPFDIGSPKLFLPFEEMHLVSTKWALWGDPVAIRMEKLGEIDIILYREAMEWAAEHSPRIAAMMVTAAPPGQMAS
ncbi:hypothetical protein [Erythrobacter sp. HKB08]|uniref:hypothetical protein n=1 Tax=Erythrobacter sp. HKB08 TaxID=2502843 RepID=UPI001008730F|nr:hypothetical protein [Erythrobacter sp. HKB08]